MKKKNPSLPSYSPSWIPDENDFNTRYEFLVAAILTRQLSGFELNIKIERNQDKFGMDLIVYYFDYNKLERGEKMRGIEIEQKKISFPEDGSWPLEWPDESFLDRKIRNQHFFDEDIYLLVDKNVSEKSCFWETFGEIRNCGTFKLIERTPDRRDRYWRRKHVELFGIQQGWESLIEYIVKLGKNQ